MYGSEQTNQNSLLSHAKYLVSLIKKCCSNKISLVLDQFTFNKQSHEKMDLLSAF